MDRRQMLKTTAAGITLAATGRARASGPPNIILILADDIGYGDLGCYSANRVRTPNLDRIAAEGVRCTDAHSSSAVCTPTRYSLLTGQYAFRRPEASYILSGAAPLCIDPSRPTLPSVLRAAGYATGMVGKWHLGLGTRERPVDYNGEIAPGPLEVGFDSAFFIPATGDRVPCVFIEDRRVVGLDPADPISVSFFYKIGDDPTGLERPDLLKMKADLSHSGTIVNGISRIGYMSGGHAARWVDEDIPDTLARRAVAFIEANRDRPFFLYLPTHDVHEPMAPNARFKGTSDCGSRGDVIHQLDWTVGEVLAALDRTGLADNTLVIFSSDNGGGIKNTYDDGTNALHSRQPPNGKLRGGKGQLYEGGHRVPLVARWPGRIKPCSESSELMCLIDMIPTLAAVAGASVPKNAAPDAVDVSPALLGLPHDQPCRDHLLLHISGPGPLAVRKGEWKLIPLAAGGMPNQLFNLADDLSEQHNLALRRPDKVMELFGALARERGRG